MNRRTFVRNALGGLVLLAAGGGLWRVLDQGVFEAGEGPAYEAWDRFGKENDIGRKLVEAAILASNPHNSQPWLFRVLPGRVDLLADMNRRNGTVDPFLRELHIGLGCALENMTLAAAASGASATVRLMPEGADAASRLAATLEWTADGAAKDEKLSRLYEAIPMRRTDRGAYDMERPLGADILESLRALEPDPQNVDVVWFTGDSLKEAGRLIVDSTVAFSEDKEQTADSHMWFRHDWDELQKRKDGITIDASGNPALTRAAAKILPNMSADSSNKYWLDSTRKTQIPTAGALGMIVVRDGSSRELQLKAGRLWQRMHLTAAAQGLAMQPMNQLNERMDREAQLGLEPRFGQAVKALPGVRDRHSIFTFRVGYPTSVPLKSPRRGLEEVLVGS